MPSPTYNLGLRKCASLLILVALIILTLWTTHTAYQEHQQKIKSHFEHKKYQTLSEFDKSFATYYQYFVSTVGLFKASEDVTQEEWKDFLKELGIFEKYPAISTMAYASYNKDDQTSIIQLIKTKEEGGHTNLIGEDLWKDPNIKLIMQESALQGVGLASSEVFFIRHDESLFFVSFPVMKKNELVGFVIGTLSIPKIIEPMIKDNSDDDLIISFYNGLNLMGGEERPIFEQSWETIFFNKPQIQEALGLSTFGYKFTIVLSTKETFGSELKTGKPYLIFIFGAFITLMLSIVMTSLFRTSQSLTRIAQEKTSLLHFFLKYNPTAVAILNKDKKYIEASDKWQRDYKILNQDIHGKSLYELSPEIKEKKPEWVGYHDRVLQGEIIKSEKEVIEQADGQKDYVRYEIRPWKNDKNEINGLMISNEMITPIVSTQKNLEESQEKFRILFEGSPVGMSLVSLDGKWVRVNKSLLDTLGYEEIDILNRHVKEFVLAEDWDRDMPLIEKMKAGQTNSYEVDKRYIHKNGDALWVHIHVGIVRDRDNQPLYFITQLQKKLF